MDLDRRDFLSASLLGATGVLLGCGGDRKATPAASARLPATPRCDDHDDPTPEETEGPFFKPRSPLRRSLVTPGLDGTRLVVSGLVLDTACRPLRRAVLDFWQADASGEYDNEGFRLRGHQRTDGHGRYRLETIVPGLYPGRTRHIHVKVARVRSADVLTTQLYFPGVRRNVSDDLYDPVLRMRMARSGRHRTGRFDFVLEA